MMNGINDELLLAARLLLATLFLIFGWRKLRDFQTWQCHLIFEMTGHIRQLWEDQAPGKESFRPA